MLMVDFSIRAHNEYTRLLYKGEILCKQYKIACIMYYIILQ